MPTADSLARLKAKPAARPQPTAPAAPVPVVRNTASAPQYSTGNYSSSIGGGGGGAVAGPVVSAAPPVDINAAAKADPGYLAQIAALQKAAADYASNNTAELGQYDVDYNKGIHDLGYNVDDPSTTDINEAGWDTKDLTRASGRSYQNMTNDFASRGMLQSSPYAESIANLMRQFDDQRGQIDTSRNNFRNDKTRALTAFNNDNQSQQSLALADAISRLTAMFA